MIYTIYYLTNQENKKTSMYIDNNSNSKQYNEYIKDNHTNYEFNYIKLIIIYLILAYIIILWLYFRLRSVNYFNKLKFKPY